MSMEKTESTSVQAELDLEGSCWNQARDKFKANHKDSEERRKFLQERETETSVHDLCATLQRNAETEYRSRLGDILEKINNLMEIGDVAMKAAPESVGIAWAGISLCLRGVRADFATFELFSGACADIVDIMISCRHCSKFLGRKLRSEGLEEIHSELVKKVPDIYCDILEFLYATKKYIKKNKIVRIGSNLFKDKEAEFRGRIESLQAHEGRVRQLFDDAYKQLNMVSQEAVSADIKEMRGEFSRAQRILHRSVVETLKGERDRMHHLAPYTKEHEKFEENRKRMNPVAEQSDLLRDNLENKREKGTCQWLFAMEEYQQWHDSPSSSMLWISGAQGYGKSILASTVIERLQEEASHAHRDTLVYYFFCRRGNDATRKTSRILQTIAFKLLNASQPVLTQLKKANEAMRTRLEPDRSSRPGEIYDDQRASSNQKFDFQNTYRDLLKILRKDVFLIIDAVDECLDRQEENFLKSLRQVLLDKREKVNIKILVCSRPEADIKDALRDVTTVLCEGNNEADIKQTVTAQLSHFPAWTASEKRNAREAIVKKAGSLFEYVRTAIDFLKKPMVRPYERRFEQLPKGLEGLYLASFNKIEAEYLDLFKIAITWALLTQGTIIVPEVMDAFSMTYGVKGGIDEEQESSTDRDGVLDLHDSQIRIAGGIFLEVSPSRTLTLRHANVEDFFLERQGTREQESHQNPSAIPNLSETHSQIATDDKSTSHWIVSPKLGHLSILKTLAQNLASPIFQKQFILPRSNRNTTDSEPALVRPKSELDGRRATESDVTNNELQEASRDSSATTQSGEEDASKKSGENLSAVSEDTGRKDATHQATANTEQEVRDEGGSTQNSVEHSETDEWSVQSSASDSLSDNGEHRDEHDTAVAVQNTTKVESRKRYELTHWQYHLKQATHYWTEEERAENPDWTEIWDSLLSFLCNDPNVFKNWLAIEVTSIASPLHDRSRNTSYGPLHVAAAYGLSALTQKLIERGYDVNECADSNDRYELPTPFRLATLNSFATTKILLENGANPNENSDDHGITAYHLAIGRHPTVEWIQLLLEHGADVTIEDNWISTCSLHWFSLRGTDKMAFDLLLRAGANVNAANRWGETPLHVIVTRDKYPVQLIEAFIEAGANINIDDNDSRQPLQSVAGRGTVEVARLLIEHHANIHDDDVYGSTALHAAAAAGNTDMVKLLLEHGANLNQVDRSGRTPLFYSCRDRQEKTADYLLDALADLPPDEINKPDSTGDSPIRNAAAQGMVEIMERLLDKVDARAVISATDSEHGRTILHVAAFYGRKESIQILLSSNADLEAKDNDGLTPIQLCGQEWFKNTSKSFEEAMLFLIEKDPKGALDCSDLLFGAAMKGSIDIIEKLLEAGADCNVKDRYDWTPLQLAKQYDQQAAVQVLSKKALPVQAGPKSWISMQEMVEIDQDGLRVKSNLASDKRITIISDQPIEPKISRYYFEINLISSDAADSDLPPVVAIGYACVPLTQDNSLPGWRLQDYERSWAWHSDDGWTFPKFSNAGQEYGGGPFDDGDCVGCAVDFKKKTIFFTRNGVRQSDVFHDAVGRLFPAIGLRGINVTRTNFGGDPQGNPFKWEGYQEWIGESLSR